MKAQYRKTKDGELILVYVNSNTDGKKWYECLNIYDAATFESTREYLMECKPQNRGNYLEITHMLSYKMPNLEIINKLPRL